MPLKKRSSPKLGFVLGMFLVAAILTAGCHKKPSGVSDDQWNKYEDGKYGELCSGCNSQEDVRRYYDAQRAAEAAARRAEWERLAKLEGRDLDGSEYDVGDEFSPPPPPPDLSPPAYTGSDPDRLIFAADQSKSVSFSLLFSDESPPLSYKKVAVGEIAYGSTTFTHDFSKAGSYDLVYDVCDSKNNCTGDVTLPGFFTVVANVPNWASSACSDTGCPSKFQLTTETKLADGVDTHAVRVQLVDRYGNPVISVPGIKQVDVTFNFRNTTKLDQIKGTGDAAVFSSGELAEVSQDGAASRIKLSDGDGDGVFTVGVKSYTPTSAGYLPIKDLSFDLNFESVDYYVQATGSSGDVGAAAVNASIASYPLTHFTFYPTLLVRPVALVWNGSNYVVDTRGVENITVNAIKRFGVYLQDNSENTGVVAPKIGIALDSNVAKVTWSDGSIERVDNTTGLNVGLNLDTDGSENFDHELTSLSGWLDQIGGKVLKVLRFRATPKIIPGATIEGNIVADLQTYVCYTIGENPVCHRGERLEKYADIGVDEEETEYNLEEQSVARPTQNPSDIRELSWTYKSTGSAENQSGQSAQLYNPGIEILGSIRSSSGTASKQTGSAINQSLGDVVQNEFQDAINRNLASLLASASGACSLDTEISSTTDWEHLGCTSHNGTVAYFRGADVTLDLAEGLLPSGVRTIVVDGGDLWIKSNLVYPNGNSSLGVIVLGGNIYVYPEVTNLVGAVYAEGGVISVNADGKFGEDSSSECDGTAGFCDRSYELRNQLYWKGLLATANTIGGSDKTSYECPSGVTCDSRETARIYDLSYLRTYHPNSGGLTAAGTDSTASFVVEYDSRIQSSTPPLFEVNTGVSGGQLGN